MFLKEILKFFSVGLSKEDLIEISDNIRKENYKSLIVVALLSMLFSFVMTIVSYAAHDSFRVTMLHATLTICSCVLLLFVILYKDPKHHLIMTETHLFCFLLVTYAIILSTVLNSNRSAVTFIAIILSLPLFFTDHPKRVALFIGLSSIFFLVFATLFDSQEVLLNDIVNGIVFSLISIIVSSYMSKVKFQNIYLKRKYQYLSETDVLTGLQNRNHYEYILEHNQNYHPSYCIYMDVNGLHELNNNEGHMAGDIMLKYIAQIFCRTFGEHSCFRVGGDEFVAFSFDEDKDQLIQAIAYLQHEANLKGYHVSIGYSAMHNNISLEKLVKKAKSMMYEEKRKYYEENNRRKMR